MSGFETIDSAEDVLGSDGSTQQAAGDLAQILDAAPENELQTVGQPEPVVAQNDEPEQLAQPSPDAQTVEEQPAQTSGQDDTKYTVKVNGEEREVTLNELREGFQLKSDYTRSKQELAEEKQRLGQQSSTIEQQREQYAELLRQGQEKLEALIPPEPDWAAMAQSDPIQHTRQRAAWDKLQSQVKAVEAERQRVAQESQQTQNQRFGEYLQAQQRAMLTARPELEDPKVRGEFFQAVNQYAVNEYGFHPQEIQGVTDHRLLLMAEKAMKYDQLQSGSKGKQRETNHVPTLVPGAKPAASGKVNPHLKQANKRLARSGSVKDAAAAMEAMFNG